VRYVVLILLCFTAFSPAISQISPPGLDDTRAVAWGAIGFTQQIGARWQTTVYFGGSRESNPDNYSLLRKPAIEVLDFTQLYRFNGRWSLAGALSFRKQNRYHDAAPFDSEDPALRDEIRYYMRLYYRHKIKRVSFIYSFRPEYRTYYDGHDRWSPVPYEFRFRLKAQASIGLNQSGSNQFVVGNEILSVAQPHFSKYRYTEDRFTTYFRHTFTKPSLIFDAGFMYQFLAGEGLITHFAVDFIFVDPFHKHSLN
jgi:hypothetical protein